MIDDYPWYTVVNGEEIQQGDLVYSCPIITPPRDIKAGQNVTAKAVEYDVIIMSQSCDLKYKHIEIALACPFYSLGKSEHPLAKGKGGREKLRKGNVPGYHLLNKCDVAGFKTDFLVVEFRNVFGVSLDYLSKRREQRLRLLPPYKEYLSQGFARFFMRVGLPVDIPPFK